MKNNMIGKKVVVRGDRSGVFFGTLTQAEGKEVELANVRKIYYWEGACAVEQLAKDGTSKPNNCKLTVTVESLVLTDAIQILICTDKSIKSLEGVAEWKK